MSMALDSEAFGSASACVTLAEVVRLIGGERERGRATRRERLLAAAYGMAIQARQSVGTGRCFEHTRHVLDQLSRAKAELDIAAWHDREITVVTAVILDAARRHVWDETIGCHEWPFPEEVAEIALRVAERIATGDHSI